MNKLYKPLTCVGCGSVVKEYKLREQVSRTAYPGVKSMKYDSFTAKYTGYCSLCDRRNELDLIYVGPRNAPRNINWYGRQLKQNETTAAAFEEVTQWYEQNKA